MDTGIVREERAGAENVSCGLDSLRGMSVAALMLRLAYFLQKKGEEK